MVQSSSLRRGSLNGNDITQAPDCPYPSCYVACRSRHCAWLCCDIWRCTSGRRRGCGPHVAVTHGWTGANRGILCHQVAPSTPQTGVNGCCDPTGCGISCHVPGLVVSLVTDDERFSTLWNDF